MVGMNLFASPIEKFLEEKQNGDRVWSLALFRYQRLLTEMQRKIADAGIRRHIKACDKLGIPYEGECVLEIVGDAIIKRAVFLEVNDL